MKFIPYLVAMLPIEELEARVAAYDPDSATEAQWREHVELVRCPLSAPGQIAPGDRRVFAHRQLGPLNSD